MRTRRRSRHVRAFPSSLAMMMMTMMMMLLSSSCSTTTTTNPRRCRRRFWQATSSFASPPATMTPRDRRSSSSSSIKKTTTTKMTTTTTIAAFSPRRDVGGDDDADLGGPATGYIDPTSRPTPTPDDDQPASPADVERLPRHVAFICDGNSRWSRRGGREIIGGGGVRNSSSIARSMIGHVAGANRVVGTIRSLLSIREGRSRRLRIRRERQQRRERTSFDEYDDDIDDNDNEDDVNSNIQCCTLFAFSTENWSRPDKEISALFGLVEEFSRMYRKYDNAMLEGRVRIRLLGDLDDPRVPISTREELRNLERTSAEACDGMITTRKRRRRRRRRTAAAGGGGDTAARHDDDEDLGIDDNGIDDDRDDALTVCLAINYGGRADILRAATQLAQSIVDDDDDDARSYSSSSSSLHGDESRRTIDESEISKRLCTADVPDVDLIIRTGGERRLSNFFLWEGAYAELYFSDTLWPDFDDESLGEALAWYGKRERRFGGR